MFNISTIAYKRWLLWLKISFFSILYHAALLFMLFFVYRDVFFEVELTVSSKGLGCGSPVMFVPIQYEQSISSVQKKTKPAIEVPRTTINKKVPLNSVVKKVQKEPKKIDQKSAQKMQSKNQSNKKMVKQFVQSDQKDVVLRVGYRDVEAMRRYNVLQKELVKYWRPPIGVLNGCSCKIKIFVSWDGSILEMDMIKQSGVLMYDVAARSALFAMSMPRWAQGKSITITFE